MKTTKRLVRAMIGSFAGMAVLCLLSTSLAFGQATPNALQFVTQIPIPNWTTSGMYAGNFDAVWFDAQNGIVYIADRINDGATAVDTKTWTVLGTVAPPGCGIQTLTGAASGNCRPSGVITTPDSQKLLFTQRGKVASNPSAGPPGLWIYDLRAPTAAPVFLQTPTTPDFIDYDPINRWIYLKTSPTGATGDAIEVINPVSAKIVTEIPMGVTIEQMRFNPVDGYIYVAVTQSGKQGLAKIDPVTNTILTTYSATCTGHQFEIDPVNDIAVIGCSESAVTMDLHSGNVISTYPQAANADTTGFNLNVRHMYISSRDSDKSSGCPQDSAGLTPVVGVISTSGTTTQLAGAACGGRAEKGAATDAIHNNVYVATPQYPASPTSASSGQAGLLVFHDSGALVTGTPAGTEDAHAQAVLTAAGGSGVQGTVDITLRRRNLSVEASLTGLTAGSTSTDLVITTTAGLQTVNCGVDGNGNGSCEGDLLGDPLIGGVVDVGSGGKFVASGPITLSATTPTFIPID